jgi:hypothetical protein
MNIITNRIPRPLQCLYDLPPAAAKDFGYLGQAEACEPRLVQYKGVWYDVLDSMPAPVPRPRRGDAPCVRRLGRVHQRLVLLGRPVPLRGRVRRRRRLRRGRQVHLLIKPNQ